MARQKRPVSLRSHLFLLSILPAIVGTALVAFAGHLLTYDLARDRAAADLKAEAQVNAVSVFAPLKRMQREAEILRRLPAVQQLADFGPDNMFMPRDELKVFFEDIFAAVLRDQPQYTQARLIFLTEGGREFARVDNRPEGVLPTPQHKLQSKGAEPYMRPLYEGRMTGYFSHLSLNRENNRVEANAPVTLRYIQPIARSDGTPFGAIVLNADFARLMQSSDRHLLDDHRLIVLTHKGDHVTFDGSTETPRLHFHAADDFSPLAWPVPDQSSGPAQAVIENDQFIAQATSKGFDSIEPDARLTIITVASRQEITAIARGVLKMDMAISFLAFTLALGLWYWTTKPLQALQELSDDMSASDKLPQRERVTEGGVMGRMLASFTHLKDRLRAEEAQLRAIFRNSVEGILLVDKDGTIVDLNPAARRLFGDIAVKGGNMDVLIPEELRHRHSELLANASLPSSGRQMAATRDVEALRAVGPRFPVEVSISPIDIDDRPLFVAMVRDISDRRAQEKAREQLVASLTAAKEELERSNAELDNFAYVASHDLKAPLRVIENASKWLEEDLEAFLDDDTRESMTLLRSRVARMERLLDDLLQHSRIGRDTRIYTPINGKDLMEIILDLVALPDAFRVEVDESLARIEVPRMPIQNVLLNLVSNAVKHHDRSDGVVGVWVVETDDALIFTVADDGPGIDAAFHERIFGLFTTLRPRDEVEGSGMGLAMVRKTVELAGGSVTLDSAPGKGSRFRVRWPRMVQDSARNGEAA